jgi:DNA-binding transcriptional LysR family regulator
MPMETQDIRLLKIFASIVESGGFAAAQSELNLSLSTISSHVSALEARLGVILCRRGRAGFKLTEEGRAAYDEIRKLLGNLDQFDDRMRGLRSQLTGTLFLGLTDNTLTDPNARLDTVIRRFSDAAPDVGLSIVTRPPNELLRDVISGQLHLAIAGFPRTTLGLEFKALYTETNDFFCGREHPLFDIPEDAITVERVRSYNLIGRSYWNSRDLKIFAGVTPKAIVSDMEAEARLILSGRFLGYLPQHFAQSFVDRGSLRCIRPDLFRYRSRFHVAHDRSPPQIPAKQLFLDILIQEYSSSTGRRA